MSRAEFQMTWEFVKFSLDRLWEEDGGSLSKQLYREVQTMVQNYCTGLCTLDLTATLSMADTHNTQQIRRLGEDLYDALGMYLLGRLGSIRESLTGSRDEELVLLYAQEWNRFEFWAESVNILCRPLNQCWVKAQIDCGDVDVCEVYTLCLIRWKHIIFDPIKVNLTAAILKLIEKHRQQQHVEFVSMKAVIQSFVTMGFDETDSMRSTIEVYWRYFEIPFLEATSTYYQRVSKSFLHTHSLTEYLAKVETWLREEKNIIVACLHPDTFGPLMRTCNQSLLQNHVGRMGDEFLFHLESRDQLELHRMFNHLSSIPNALNEFYHQFSKHVMRVELFATSSLVNGTADSSTAKAYIKELLEIHAYYDTLIKTAFASDAKFLRCFDEWFVQFVNKNGVCQQKPDKSAMLLAAHADSLLRESIHTQEIELADKLAGVMTIFQYLMDKETFHIAYSKRMADRLLKGRSLSVQAEKLMIGSLHEAGGFEHTRKLETMLEDTKISSALNVEFQRWLRESGWLRVGAGVSFQVLRAWSWPLAIDPSSSGTSFIPPKSIANAHSRFDKFYKSKHVGRELRWMWHLCNGELKANFDSSPRAPYVFRVSAYQMSILLLFNSHATISYDSIQQKTGLGEEHLHQYLSVFLYAGLLNISPDSSHPVSGTQFALNPNFSSPKIKVNLLRNGGAERERKNIEEIRAEQERQRCLEITVSNIMEHDKILKRGVLMQKTIYQINPQFTPTISAIEAAIDTMIHKKYLERQSDGRLGKS